MKLRNALKIRIKVTLTALSDLATGHAFRFAKKSRDDLDFPYSIELTQEIKPSETYADKHYNISLAAETINGSVLLPNQVFSFWKIMGNPNLKLKKSRSIINGAVTNEIGGGICQVSGIIYHAAISAGLQIVQRHNHSIDLYTEETRFAPLGTDATVVYGYKDLRIQNNFSAPVKFELAVNDNSLSMKLLSASPLEKKALIFELENKEGCTIAIVKDEHKALINKSVYKNLS